MNKNVGIPFRRPLVQELPQTTFLTPTTSEIFFEKFKNKISKFDQLPRGHCRRSILARRRTRTRRCGGRHGPKFRPGPADNLSVSRRQKSHRWHKWSNHPHRLVSSPQLRLWLTRAVTIYHLVSRNDFLLSDP